MTAAGTVDAGPTCTLPGSDGSGSVTDDIGLGERFAAAVATGDRSSFVALLEPQVDLRALTPGAVFQVASPDEAADLVLGRWFGGDHHIEEVESIETDQLADRHRVSYRFQVGLPEGPHVVEQQAYFSTDPTGARIAWMRILCTGFRPLEF